MEVQDLNLKDSSVVDEPVLLCLCHDLVSADPSHFLGLAVVGLLVPIEAVLRTRVILHGDIAEESGFVTFRES